MWERRVVEEEDDGKEEGSGGVNGERRRGNGGGKMEGIGGELRNDVKKLGQGWKKMVERTRRKGLLNGEKDFEEVTYYIVISIP